MIPKQIAETARLRASLNSQLFMPTVRRARFPCFPKLFHDGGLYRREDVFGPEPVDAAPVGGVLGLCRRPRRLAAGNKRNRQLHGFAVVAEPDFDTGGHAAGIRLRGPVAEDLED